MPVSVRLTHEERVELKQAAGGKSLSYYIRSRLFNHGEQAFPDDEIRFSAVARQKLLAQILIRLGQSGLAENLRELNEVAKLGLLDTQIELRSTLSELRKEVKGLRSDLIKALGLRPRKGDDK